MNEVYILQCRIDAITSAYKAISEGKKWDDVYTYVFTSAFMKPCEYIKLVGMLAKLIRAYNNEFTEEHIQYLCSMYDECLKIFPKDRMDYLSYINMYCIPLLEKIPNMHPILQKCIYDIHTIIIYNI